MAWLEFGAPVDVCVALAGESDEYLNIRPH